MKAANVQISKCSYFLISVIPLTEFLEEWNDDDADVKSKCHLQSLRFSDNSTSVIAADVERVI